MLAGAGLKIPFHRCASGVARRSGHPIRSRDGVSAAGFIISRDEELLHPRALGTAAREGDLDAQAPNPTVH